MDTSLDDYIWMSIIRIRQNTEGAQYRIRGRGDIGDGGPDRDGRVNHFTTTPQLISASVKVAVNHPEATIMNCSLNTSHKVISTYYARLMK